jgi:hypothetical protein
VGALSDIPSGLLVGWTIWLAGGLLLMVWFRRRSAPRLHRPSRASAASSAGRRPLPRPPTRPSARTDAFDELQSLLDPPENHRVG